MTRVTSYDLPAGEEALTWVNRRAAAAARTWTPAQRTHPGDVAWSAAQHDRDPMRRTRVWEDQRGEIVAWSRVEPASPDVAYADVHVGAAARDAEDLAREVVSWSRSHADGTVLPLLDRERLLVSVVRAGGGREQEGPWFVHLFTELGGPRAPRLRPCLPAGYRLRQVAAGEEASRVEVHRQAWAPARIKSLMGVEPAADEQESLFSLAAYDRVKATAHYRPDLDLVIEAPGGALASSALGWYDERSASGLIEPVGTAPSFAQRGLARAACAELVLRLARMGARQALVCPRGDDGYPVPAHLYRSLGMLPMARTRTYLMGPVGAGL